MGLGNILLLGQTAGYTVSLILSFCIHVPMIINLVNFRGNCLLYSTGTFIEFDGRFEPNWSSRFYCGFNIFIGFFLLIASLVQIIRMSIFLYKAIDSSFLSALVDTILALLMSICVLVDAILVSSGFKVWCNAVTERFPSCQTATVMKIGSDNLVKATGFFIEIGTVQFGIWSCLVCWVLLLVLTGRKLSVYHERENIIVSMARERQRYVKTGYSNVESS